jgi:hypothetical protein
LIISYKIEDNSKECVLINNHIPFSNPNGIILNNDTYYISATYEIIKLKNNSYTRISIPNFKFTAISKYSDNILFLSTEFPKNSILEFDIFNEKILNIFDLSFNIQKFYDKYNIIKGKIINFLIEINR